MKANCAMTLNRIYIILVNILFLVSFFGCYESKEGCLDVSATNYDASADENCCCTYPKLIVNLDHKVDSINYIKLDSTYYNNLNVPFAIKSVQFYLSSFQLKDTINDLTVSVKDSILINTGDYIHNDIAFFTRTATSSNVGQITTGSTFQQLAFSFGNRTEVDRALPSDFSTSHPLYVQSPAMYDSTAHQYLQMRLEIFNPEQTNITKILTWKDDPITILLDAPYVSDIGYNITYKMALNYLQLLEGIDIWNEDDDTVIEKIKENIPNSFSILAQ